MLAGWFSAAVVALLLALSLGGTNGQVVRGAGGEVGIGGYFEWGNGYNMVTDQIRYTFTSYLNSSDGIRAYERGELDFLAIDAPIPPDPRFIQIPELGGAIVLSYALFTLPPRTSLNFSREAIALIWLGNITNWNDQTLVDLNPNVTLPDKPIILTWLPKLGVTKWFAHALASFMEDIAPEVAAELREKETLQFLPPVVEGTRVRSCDLTTDCFMYLGVEGSLLYSINDGFYASALTSVAKIYNRANQLVGPTASAIRSALLDFRPQSNDPAELARYIVDGPGVDTYPLSILSLLILRVNFTAITCDGNRLHLDQVLWGLTNRQIGLIVEDKGYTPMITSWSAKVINLLSTITCNGERLLSSTLLSGVGANAPFFSSLGFFYAKTQPTLTSQYAMGGGFDDVLRGDVNYAGLMNVENNAESAYPSLAFLPIATVPISVGCNLPEIRAQNASIRLTLNVLAKIYLGQITKWNHGDIAGLNDGVTLPDKDIIVVLDDSGSVNYPLSLAFSKASTDFANTVGNGTNVTFPVTNTLVSITTDVGLVVNSNAYTIACLPLYTFIGYAAALRTSQQAIANSAIGFANVTQIQLINKDGFSVLPSISSAKAAADAATTKLTRSDSSTNDPTTIAGEGLDKRQASGTTGSGLVADLTDVSGQDSWPLSTYFYYVLRRDSTGLDCARAKQLASLIYWATDNSQASTLMLIDSVARASDATYSQVLDALATLTCEGDKVFAQSGCVYQGTLCSNAGTCSSDGVCSCNSGREGQYCEKVTSDGLSDGAIAGIVVGVVIPFLLLLILIIIAIIMVVKLLRRKKKEEWVIDPSELEWGDVLGAGGFGEVRKAMWRGTEVAVKTINSGYSNELRNAFIEEVRIMTALRHPNVVLFMAAATKPPNLCIVMEWMTLGSLRDVLSNELIPQLPTALRIKILRQASRGMYFLHSSGIVHRDLKSLNLLLDTKWNVKVSDFGLTRFRENMKKGDQNPLGAGGSVHWTAPEVLNEASNINYLAADVYSFGIIMWEVHTRDDPYMGMSPAAIAVAVLRDDMRPEIPEDMPLDYRTLMCEAWSSDPSVRPNFLELMTRLDSMVENSSHSLTGNSWTSSSTAVGHNSITGSRRYSEDDDSNASSRSLRAMSPLPAGIRAPSGEMAIVFTDIVRALALWEFNASAMRDATLAHNDLLRELLVPYDGYEVSFSKDGTSGEGSMCVVFQDVEKAIRWCIQVQADLLKLEWPVELLTHPAAAEEWGDVDDRIIFKGPRVRMGIHFGEPRKVIDPITRRAEYMGPPVNTAARITTLAEGGQVLFSDKVLEKFKECDLAKERNRYASLGKCELPDSPEGAKLYELRVPGLEGRFFGGAARKDKPVDHMDDDNASHSSGDSDNVIEMGDERNEEESFLTSANLCRWIVDYKDIQLGKQIGTGSYGLVFRGKWKGIDVAVKRFIKQKLTEKRLLEFRAEMAFLSELHHPNVVLFIGACVKRPNLCIVTEFMHFGSMREVLSDRSVKLPYARRLAMLRSAAMGVNYLHTLASPVIHRDLKSSNLLVDENMNVKVADFGFARLKEENATMTRCGTPCWTAPEIIRGERYSEKADVYSYGIVMWEVLTRKTPYANKNFMGVSMDVLEGKRPQIPHDCPEAFRKLMQRCWHAKPDKRPDMSEVIEVLSHLVGEDTLLSQT